MNILKIYENDLSTNGFLEKLSELKKIGRFSDYIDNEKTCVRLNHHFYHGNKYIKNFLNLIKNNSDFANYIKDITIENIVNDNNEYIISIKKNNEIFKVDLKNKKISNYKNKNFVYGDDYIIKLDESKNISKPITKTNEVKDKPINNDSKPQKEKSNTIVPIEKIESIEKYIDMTDPTSKAIISTFWSNDNVKLFKSKMRSIISKIPEIYREEFKLNKFYTKDGTKANINDFTLIGKTGKKLHCILNPTNNKFSCSID